MAIKSGFFNSNQGDRVYNSDDLSTIYEGILSDGVVRDIGAELEVSANPNGGMSVIIGIGKAVIADKWVKITDEEVEIQLDKADTQYPRIDTIVARLDPSGREISFAAKTGVAQTNPYAPSCIYSPRIKEIPMAHVAIAANTTTIIDSNITDKRQFATLYTSVQSATRNTKMHAYIKRHTSISDVGPQIFDAVAGQTAVYDVDLGGIHQTDVAITFTEPISISDSQYVSVAVPLPNDMIFPSFAQVTILGKQGDIPVSIYGVTSGHGDYIGEAGVDLSKCGFITFFREPANIACAISGLNISFMYNADDRLRVI